MSHRRTGVAWASRAAPSTAPPRGTRAPQPDVLLVGLRAVVVLSLLVVLGAGPLEAWATARIQDSTDGAARGWAVAAHAVRAIREQPLVNGSLLMLGALGLAGMTAELLIVMVVVLPMQQAAVRRRWRDVRVLRVRLPQVAARSGPRLVSDPDQDLFRAMYQALPTQGRTLGHAPWAALTLRGQPDQPVEFGLVVAGATAAQRTRVAVAISNALVGVCPAAQVDPQPDPLMPEVAPGRVIAWREFGLRRPVHYPIRFLDDVDGSTLLGQVLAALRPRDRTLMVELQLTVRPASSDTGWTLHRGWRGRAMALKLTLEAKRDYALAPDVKALEAKRAGAPYEVTLRAVAIADGEAATRSAQAALGAVTDALGEYQARPGGRLQRFVVLGGGTEHVRDGWARPARRWPWLLAAAGAAVLTAQLDLATSLLTHFAGRWPVVPLTGGTTTVATGLFAPLLAVGIGLLVLAAGRRLSGVSQAERLQAVVARAPRFAPPPPGLLPLRPWRRATILSSAELGGLWHLPTPALGTLVRWLPCRLIPAPPQAFTAGKADRIVIGYGWRADGTTAPVGPTLRDLRQILHATAGMGAGKTRLLANVCQQLIPTGLTLIDGKGDDRAGSLVATVRELIPLADERRLIILDVLDAGWPVGLNPLAGVDLTGVGGKDLVLGQVLATFARIDPATWGKSVGMQQYLQMATLLVLESEAQPTLANVKQALVDPDYRERLLQAVRNPEVKTFWEVTFPTLGESQRSSRDALLRRFDLLLTTETTRYLVTQAAPSFDFLEAIEEGLVVLVPLPDLTLGGLAGAIGTLIFQAFVRAAFGRAGSDQTRVSYPLIVDELQVLVGTGDARDVETALTRLRSLGIPAIYAHQALQQLGDLADIMRINAANRVILQTQEPDASIYARQFAADGVTAADISGQDPLEHQYAALRCDGVPTRLFSLCPLPWPSPLPAEASSHAGPDWWMVLPVGSPDPSFDRAVLELVYGDHADPQFTAACIAEAYGDASWRQLLARWDAIRAAQRQYILDHPGCVPDRLERQRWLSRLLVARPRILAEIEYLRQRPAIGAVETGRRPRVGVTGGVDGGAGGERRSTGGAAAGGDTPVEPPEHASWATPATRPEPSPVVPDPAVPRPEHRFFE